MLISCLGLLHVWAIWFGFGGWEGVSGPWPLARHDHPLYFHSAVISRHFLKLTGTTAGYDPAFMAGYAKSVVFPASSTLPEVVFALAGGEDPIRLYKLYVFLAAAAAPWLVLIAGRLLGVDSRGLVWSIALFLVYLWTDFPIQYVNFGMLPYFLGVPSALLATALLVRFLSQGGLARWLLATLSCALAFLVHLTVAMVVVPAAMVAYGVGVWQARRRLSAFPMSRHLGFWAIPPVVLVINAFWWWPGVWLSSTKGESGFAFSHSEEGVLSRVSKLLSVEPEIQITLCVLGIPGLILLGCRDRLAAAGLAGLALAGFCWGYGAGGSSALDFLQPGRHTYVLYSSLALASGLGLREGILRLQASAPRLGIWAAIGLLLVGTRIFGSSLSTSIALNLGDPLPGLTRVFAPALAESFRRAGSPPEPFLSSRPTPRFRWVISRVREHVQPGERLLYEEGGFAVEGLEDPFAGGRYSGLLPHYAPGVELLGGPYLHAALTTNFTQFGEGRLFGAENWGRDHFDRYARLYRPSAILCWSPRARSFCLGNPDLIEILDDDGILLIGRVRGYGGPTIEGDAEVEARPGMLRVRRASGELDGRVVLRYHFVPCLRSHPAVRIEPVYMEGDPVPFIGLRPPPGTSTLQLDFVTH